ncbi:hypothetical protein Scep_014863 [Stephania cephalantha]|uniref:Uncharacterized protein n=1 Tax=Stephania cephalantha TaxID=152367 RepID=A0AAP0J465_9MAGN
MPPTNQPMQPAQPTQPPTPALEDPFAAFRDQMMIMIQSMNIEHRKNLDALTRPSPSSALMPTRHQHLKLATPNPILLHSPTYTHHPHLNRPEPHLPPLQLLLTNLGHPIFMALPHRPFP